LAGVQIEAVAVSVVAAENQSFVVVILEIEFPKRYDLYTILISEIDEITWHLNFYCYPR
jgi:HJR/Mrr/RecB family endonuclease